MKKLEKITNYVLNTILSIFAIAGIWLFLQVFIFTSFRIPSDSMAPELEAGDCVLVNKLILGPRLFDLSASMQGEQVEIYRVPGFKSIERNNILVFNFPHPHTWEKIEMHLMKYYIKRCIGLPGDTLSIENGIYQIKNCPITSGNLKSQQRIRRRAVDSFEEGVFRSFPYDTILNWNIKDFGPLYIPKAGTTITMDRTHFCFYRKIIEWEQKGALSYHDSTVYLNDIPLKEYQFQKNYYFMAGDNGENSQDSRYWGFLPEEYIVGKATRIWKSVDLGSGKWRWERVLKRIE